MAEEIEFRVRPVTRFIVTRWHHISNERGESGGCIGCGEFENKDLAVKVANALFTDEHRRLLNLNKRRDSGNRVRVVIDD